VRHDERAIIDIEGGVRWERLTPWTLEDVEFLELIYSPGAASNETLYRHPGMEMVLVLSGMLEILVAFERYELAAGDSICFPSTTPHRYRNPGTVDARAVTVILPEAQSRSGGRESPRLP
jgi:mannose-6-phosphate isomerase-like protein (cupin superfamily)